MEFERKDFFKPIVHLQKHTAVLDLMATKKSPGKFRGPFFYLTVFAWRKVPLASKATAYFVLFASITTT